jgi:hypothetical protein
VLQSRSPSNSFLNQLLAEGSTSRRNTRRSILYAFLSGRARRTWNATRMSVLREIQHGMKYTPRKVKTRPNTSGSWNRPTAFRLSLNLVNPQLLWLTVLSPDAEVEPVQLRHQARGARPLRSPKLRNFAVVIYILLLDNGHEASTT